MGDRGVENAGSRDLWKTVRVWKTRGVENTGCGKRGVAGSVEKAVCGKREVPLIFILKLNLCFVLKTVPSGLCFVIVRSIASCLITNFCCEAEQTKMCNILV